MDNKEKGKQLEEQVAEELQKIFQENPSIRPTKGSSGGQRNTEIADINSQNIFCECKSQKGKWFNRKVWAKLLNSLPFGSIKIPLYVIEDDVEGILIMLSFQDFCNLLKKHEK